MKVTTDAVFHSQVIHNVPIRYRIIGSGKKMLFLHGTWVDPFIFEELLNGLSTRYEILVPDIPPFGKSRSRQTLTLDQYADLFDELLQSNEWKDVRVVGHSFGGGIALHMGARSQNISQIIGCNPIGIPFQRPEILKKYPSMVYKAISKLANKKDSTILTKILTDVGRVLLKNPLQPIVSTITQCLCEDEHILKGISVPVTVLWAKQDELLPLSYMKRLKTLVPHVQIHYFDGHHNWCLVDQQYTLRLLLKVLS